MYICPKCKGQISRDARRLIYHLRHVHALSDGQDYTLVCSQDQCQRTYHSVNSYSKHLKRDHSHANVVPFETKTENITSSQTSSIPTPSGASETDMDCSFDSTTDVNTTVNSDLQDLKNCAAGFVAKMYSASNTTLTDVQKSITCTKELLEKTLDCLQEKTVSVLNKFAVPQNDEAVQNLLQNFEEARNMFEDVDTTHKMCKHFSEKLSLIKSTEIFLGYRGHTGRKHGTSSQAFAADTCQYIPISETVKFLFRNEHMQAFYRQTFDSHDGKMYDYSDGLHFKRHELYKKHRSALQIQLYFDDLETTNPLGSKTKIHRMGAVYFCIRNLPAEFNSALANIHLCLLFNSIDKETYGFEKIFAPLLDDLKSLETRGIQVNIGGQETTLFGTICVFTADNLGCHSLGGFVESFSANKFCHFCMVDKEMAQKEFDDDKTELCNKENYQLHVAQENPSATGVKGDSCLNSLKYFHITENVRVDVMHDILEGVAPLEIKLMLHHFIYVEKLFTLEQLNDKITSFDYGYNNGKSKPSIILNLRTGENTVKQTASQMWCLLLFLPFFIGDFVSEESQHWQLFLLLRNICDIVFAPVTTTGMALYLKQLIIDHHNLFKTLYPERKLIPKHHFMTHYWRLTIQFGPLVRLWCMRFEGKHSPLKRHAHIVCNFVNISKTLAYKHQVSCMYTWMFGDPLERPVTVTNNFQVAVGSLVKYDLLIEKNGSLRT